MAEQNNGHLTAEELSASLDKQLSPQEQAVFDAHLRTCARCQQRLADLQGTVALLHALPQAELPRSFVLPTRTEPIPLRSNSPVRAGNSNQVRLYALQRSLRVLSSIAAVVGIVFLLSGFFAAFPHGGAFSGSSTSAPSTSSGAIPSVHNARTPGIGATKTPPQRNTNQPGVATPVPGLSPRPTPTAVPSHAHTHSAGQSPLPALDISEPGGREVLGGILLMLGVLGLIFMRRRREE